MDSDARPHAALHAALTKLLRPLFRLLLRHHVPFGAFEEMAKRVYIEVALNDFGIPGKKPSISRASILSGLTRKEVQRLLRDPDDGCRCQRRARQRALQPRRTRADRLGARQPSTSTPRASRSALERRRRRRIRRAGAAPQRRHAGARRARRTGARRRGAAPRRRPDRACWRAPTCRAAAWPTSSAILGSDVADLIATIDHNLQHAAPTRASSARSCTTASRSTALPAFRKLSAASAQALLEKLDRWLAEHDIDEPARRPRCDARPGRRRHLLLRGSALERTLVSNKIQRRCTMNIQIQVGDGVRHGTALLLAARRRWRRR